MRKQKIIKVGNSYAITIPAEFVKEGKLAVGDELVVEHNAQNGSRYIQKASKRLKPGLTPEFFEWLDETIEKDKDLIKQLANT